MPTPRRKPNVPASQRRHARARAVAMLLGACVLPPFAAAQTPTSPAAAQATRQSYAIPAGPLGPALRRLAAGANLLLSYTAAQAEGRSTAGVQGLFTPEEALTQLLDDTGLRAVRLDQGGYVLREAEAAAPASTLPALHARATAAPVDGLAPAYAGGQLASGARLGMLGNTSFLDNPFNQSSYTAEAIEDRQARSLSDLLLDEPSVRVSTARNNISEDFSIRGLPVASGDVSFDGLYGLMPYYRVPVEIAERVEVLKGPSALLNGMAPSGNVGGAINVVPKRAEDEALTRLSASVLSDSVLGLSADVGRRFGEDQAFGVRLNSAWRDGDTTTDRQQQRDHLQSLALDYRGERLKASVDLLYQKQHIDGTLRQFIAASTLESLPSAPDASLAYPGFGYSETTDKMAAARVEYAFSDDAGVYVAGGQRRMLMDALTGNPTLQDTDGNFVSYPAWQIYRVVDKSYAAGGHARLDTGALTHELAINVTRLDQTARIDFDTFWGARESNLYSPSYSDTPDKGDASIDLKRYNDTRLDSVALADTLSWLDDRLRVTLGARHQRVQVQGYDFSTGLPSGRRYDESRITPAVGVVLRWQPGLSLYANYIEGLSQGPVAPTSGVSNPGEVFAPIRTKQHEVGAKADWGRLAASLGLFQIVRPSAGLADGRYGVNGEQRNRGLELNVFGMATPAVHVIGGMTLMHGELTRTAGGSDDGHDAIAVPRVQANLGVDWRDVLLPGLSLNARVVHTGHQYADSANTLRLPKWTRLDVGARYRTEIAGRPLTLRAAVENLFDKDYWASSNEGYLYLGTPRTLLVTGSVDF